MKETKTSFSARSRLFFGNIAKKIRLFPQWLNRHPTLLLCASAFLIPFVLCACMYFLKGSFPFGDGSVLVLDLNAQYVSFYEEMQDILRGDGSIIYTWQRALGGEFLGILAYYVASPFLFLLLLFPSGAILDAIFLIFLCKAGACGATMAFYLSRRHPNPDSLPILLFSSMYALCAYGVVHMHNSMWIDALVYLPLLVYGIEELITRRRGILFAIMLSLTVLANFYIGYMVCIFTAIYFFYAYFGRENCNPQKEKLHFLRSLGRIALYSAVALAIAAVIILPAYYSLQLGKSDFTTPSYELTQNYTFLELLGKLFPGSYDSVRPEGMPFLYAGTLSLIFVPFYFICRRVSTREKIAGGVMISLFFISFNLSLVDLVWHGFQFPNWLNHRYSFLLVFFLVLFAYRAFCELDFISYRHILAVCAIETLVLFFIEQTSDKFHEFAFVWVSLACIAIFVLVLYALKHEKCARFARSVLCVAVSLELCLVGLLNLALLDEDVGFTSRSNYIAFQNKVTPITEQVLASDPSFYRMEKTISRMKNDIMQFNMNGLSNSTSTLHAKALIFLNRMGLISTANWSEYRGGNPLSDSLLGLKYIISDKPLNENFYQLYATDPENGMYAYYNPYALSVAAAVSPVFKDMVWSDETKLDYNHNIDNYESACVLLNAMTSAMLGQDPDNPTDFFVGLEHKILYKNTDHLYDSNFNGMYGIFPTADGRCSITFSFTVPDENPVYLFLPIYEGYRREGDILITRGNGDTYDWEFDTVYQERTDCILQLGQFNAGETIRVRITPKDGEMYFASGEQFFFSLNTDAVKAAMQSLQQTQMHITEFSDTSLKGTITVSDDRTLLYTSIPYDKNWRVYLDGVECETFETAEALVGAVLTVGEHEIELRYVAKEFSSGLAIAAGGIFALIGLGIWEHYRDKKSQKAHALCPPALPLPEEENN